MKRTSLLRKNDLVSKWSAAIVAASLLTSAAFVGCSGDDSQPGTTTDASVDDAMIEGDAHLDSSSPKDASTPVDANDAATVCTSAPDAAMYDPGAIDAGGQIVVTKGCHGCHTSDLSGNTTAIGVAYPKNLTPDPATGLGCWTDDEIARAVLTGVDDQGEQLCVMPKFAGSIDDAGISELVAYLRSIPAVDKVIPETTCPTDAGEDAD